MIYRGVVSNGVIVLEGEKLRDGTLVEVAPVQSAGAVEPPAAGIWRDRTDLPHCSGDASLELRRKAERRESDA